MALSSLGSLLASKKAPPTSASTDVRDDYIARVVRGKTFADVGGLWGTVNEKVSVARRHDAAEVTMIDYTPEQGDLWRLFHDRMKSLEIDGYQTLCGDITAPADVEYDVVHCSGVLYHHPNPFQILAGLKKITREYLILCSAITQSSISNRHGRYEIPPSGVLFVPALDARERAILAEYWRSQGAECQGITTPCEFQLDNYGPWWWLPTAKALTAMCEAGGFEVLDAGPFWNDNAHTLLLRVK